MKINLITSMDNPPLVPDHDNITMDNIDQINNSICQSIILNNILKFLTQEQFESILRKIRHGGIITIYAPDIMEMSKALYWGTIDLPKFSSLVSHSVTYHTVKDIKNLLEQRGYIIEEANINTESLTFSIKAKRP